MSPKDIFLAVAILLSLSASYPYARGMIKGVVKPHMFSWIVWATACGTAAAAQLLTGGGAGSWMMILNTVWCIGIAIASYWVGTTDIKRSDWAVLIIALSAIPVWVITKDPLWSVLIAIGVDAVAYYPTIRKSWTNPHHESLASWSMSILTFGFTILALEQYRLTTYLYPLCFSIINSGLVILLMARRHALKKVKT